LKSFLLYNHMVVMGESSVELSSDTILIVSKFYHITNMSKQNGFAGLMKVAYFTITALCLQRLFFFGRGAEGSFDVS